MVLLVFVSGLENGGFGRKREEIGYIGEQKMSAGIFAFQTELD